jgi:glycosyltransferase involved in cell wall biosynthesis
MSIENEKVRVLLLAPEKAVGGITMWAKYLQKYSNPEKVEYHVIDTSKLYDPLGKRLGFRGAVLGLRDAIARFFRVVRAIIMFHPHLIHFTCAPSIGLVIRDVPLMFLLWLLRIRTIAHLHGGNLDRFFGGFILRRLIIRNGLRCCRAIFVITREVERAGRTIFTGDKVTYVPNMIDDDVVSFEGHKHIHTIEEKTSLKLIHVGWQAPEKGSLDLVKAMRHVQTPVSCDLVGETAPDHQESIENRIREYKVGNKIRLVGFKASSDLENIFKQADIFVLPSHFEGFPYVILEAMAYGLPIIASDVGNIREMIGFDGPEPAGLLLKQTHPINAVELAELIDELATDPTLRIRLSQNGRKRVANKYLASKVVPKLEDLFKDLVCSTGGHIRREL